MFTKHDVFLNDFEMMKALERLDKTKGNYIYLSLEFEEPKHDAFLNVEPYEGCWLVELGGEATPDFVELFDLIYWGRAKSY